MWRLISDDVYLENRERKIKEILQRYIYYS